MTHGLAIRTLTTSGQFWAKNTTFMNGAREGRAGTAISVCVKTESLAPENFTPAFKPTLSGLMSGGESLRVGGIVCSGRDPEGAECTNGSSIKEGASSLTPNYPTMLRSRNNNLPSFGRHGNFQKFTARAYVVKIGLWIGTPFRTLFCICWRTNICVCFYYTTPLPRSLAIFQTGCS